MPTGIGRSQKAIVTSAYDGERTNCSKTMMDGWAAILDAVGWPTPHPSSARPFLPSASIGTGSEWSTLTSFQSA